MTQILKRRTRAIQGKKSKRQSKVPVVRKRTTGEGKEKRKPKTQKPNYRKRKLTEIHTWRKKPVSLKGSERGKTFKQPKGKRGQKVLLR